MLLDGPVVLNVIKRVVKREEGICFIKCLSITLSKRQGVRTRGFCNCKFFALFLNYLHFEGRKRLGLFIAMRLLSFFFAFISQAMLFLVGFIAAAGRNIYKVQLPLLRVSFDLRS